MCTEDFYNAQCNNRRIDAKLDAELDAIYQRERAKYGLPSDYDYYGSDSDFDDGDIYVIKARLDSIERRLDTIENAYRNLNKTSFGSPFVIVKDGKVSADTSIYLTDEQFKNLLKSILE